MKKIISNFVFYFSFLSNIFAQPILENSIFPTIGDTVDYISLSSGQGILPGNSGANISWDFSNLNLNGTTSSIAYVDPATTPYAGLLPETNMAKFYSIDQIEYYKKTLDSLSFQGKKVTGVGTQVYSNTRLDFKVPMNFGESFSDTFATNFVNGSGVSVTRTGNLQTEFDSYGTLILPNQTISNCIRIKTAKFTHDVTSSAVNDYYDTLYYWYSPICRDYILYYYTSNVSGSQYSYGYVRTNFSLNSVPEISSLYSKFHIFPNPASETMTISLPENTANTDCILFDYAEKEMKRFVLLGGENLVDVSELECGIYMIQIGTQVMRIIKN